MASDPDLTLSNKSCLSSPYMIRNLPDKKNAGSVRNLVAPGKIPLYPLHQSDRGADA